MVNIKKKTIKNKPYYYLEHSYRKNGKIKKKQHYLGSEIPKNITVLKQRFLVELVEELYIPQCNEIKQKYHRQTQKQPKAIQEKETEIFAIRFTYATNKIEGSTLTLRETAELLQKGIAPTRRPIEDIKEAETHKTVFYDMLAYKHPISLPTLLHWHKELFEHTKKDKAGIIRDYPVGISGSKFVPPYPIELDILLQEFFKWYQEHKKTLHPVMLAALVHLKLVTIHPFGDGNGRITRLFMNYVLHRNGYPMFVIDYSERNSYYSALERSQLNDDEGIFTLWFFRRYLKEYEHLLE